MCKRVLVLILVLGWTQCLPQEAGALPAMLRGRMTGFPKKLGGRGGGIDGHNLHSPHPRLAHQPRAGCIRLVLYLIIMIIIMYLYSPISSAQ